VQVKVRLSNPEHPERGAEQVDAVIDTGAPRSVVPRSMVDKLALPALDEAKTYAAVEFAGCKAVSELVISETAKGVTISLATLTTLGLEFDPFTGQLRPVPATS
jgi:predicted aspartyl protease